MNHSHKLLGYYNYTVILTYIGMLTGFVGVVYAFEGNSMNAIVCLMVAGFCDMFDGTIASTMERTRQEKNFGIQIDSLSDLICFGVLPASIVYSLNEGSEVVLIVSALYVLCALIRLAYFNVDEQERQMTSSESREIYFGLPVTLSALFLPLFYSLISLRSGAYMHLAPVLVVMSALFLIPFQTKKPKIVGKICVALCGIAEVALVIFTCTGV